MNESQLFNAAQNMRSMGSFAASISDAYFAADSYNRETLVQAFEGLFERAYEQTNPQPQANDLHALAAGLNFHSEWSKTRDFMLDVISADGPCTLRHVWLNCRMQGITKGFDIALQSLKNSKLIETDSDDENVTIVSLV